MIFKKKIDSLGRVVLPKAVRDFLGIKEDDMLDIVIDGEKIIIYKSEEEITEISN